MTVGRPEVEIVVDGPDGSVSVEVLAQAAETRRTLCTAPGHTAGSSPVSRSVQRTSPLLHQWTTRVLTVTRKSSNASWRG